MKVSIMFGRKRRDVVKAAFSAAVAVLIAASSSAALSAGLSRETFRNPPQEAKPHTWWHWMNGNVTKEGRHWRRADIRRGAGASERPGGVCVGRVV